MVAARQKNTHTFSIDHNSEQDGMRYTGKFTIKKLAIRDLAALGVRKAQLNGGMYFSSDVPGRGVDESTDDFNNMIAHLELSIKEAPDWWNLDQISDLGLIGLVFKEVMDFEQSFLSRQTRRAQTGRDGEGNSTGSVSTSNSSGAARPVVDSEVSAALEP